MKVPSIENAGIGTHNSDTVRCYEFERRHNTARVGLKKHNDPLIH